MFRVIDVSEINAKATEMNTRFDELIQKLNTLKNIFLKFGNESALQGEAWANCKSYFSDGMSQICFNFGSFFPELESINTEYASNFTENLDEQDIITQIATLRTQKVMTGIRLNIYVKNAYSEREESTTLSRLQKQYNSYDEPIQALQDKLKLITTLDNNGKAILAPAETLLSDLEQEVTNFSNIILEGGFPAGSIPFLTSLVDARNNFYDNYYKPNGEFDYDKLRAYMEKDLEDVSPSACRWLIDQFYLMNDEQQVKFLEACYLPVGETSIGYDTLCEPEEQIFKISPIFQFCSIMALDDVRLMDLTGTEVHDLFTMENPTPEDLAKQKKLHDANIMLGIACGIDTVYVDTSQPLVRKEKLSITLSDSYKKKTLRSSNIEEPREGFLYAFRIEGSRHTLGKDVTEVGVWKYTTELADFYHYNNDTLAYNTVDNQLNIRDNLIMTLAGNCGKLGAFFSAYKAISPYFVPDPEDETEAAKSLKGFKYQYKKNDESFHSAECFDLGGLAISIKDGDNDSYMFPTIPWMHDEENVARSVAAYNVVLDDYYPNKHVEYDHVTIEDCRDYWYGSSLNDSEFRAKMERMVQVSQSQKYRDEVEELKNQ